MLDMWRHDVEQEISSERTCVRKIARGFRKIPFVENGLVARDRVIALAADAVGQDGVAWFQVYEGDASGVSKATTVGWQENRRLASYLPEIAAHLAVTEIVSGGLIRAQLPYGEPWEAANEVWATLEQALDTGALKVRHRYHGFDIWTDIAAAA